MGIKKLDAGIVGCDTPNERRGQQAAAAGIRRFIYISSIKVNGENTNSGQAFTEADIPLPQSAYAHSKAEAEKHLFALGQKTGFDVVIKNRDNTLYRRAQEYKKQQSLVSVTVCPALVCDHVPH